MNASQDAPVAWRRLESGIWVYYETKAWDDLEPLYTAPPPPVGGLQGVSDADVKRAIHTYMGIESFEGGLRAVLEQFAASRPVAGALPAEPLEGLRMGPWVEPVSPFAGFKLIARFDTEEQAKAAKSRLAATPPSAALTPVVAAPQAAVDAGDEAQNVALCDCGRPWGESHHCAYQNGHDIYSMGESPATGEGKTS
jgi:hypothetical protein